MTELTVWMLHITFPVLHVLSFCAKLFRNLKFWNMLSQWWLFAIVNNIFCNNKRNYFSKQNYPQLDYLNVASCCLFPYFLMLLSTYIIFSLLKSNPRQNFWIHELTPSWNLFLKAWLLWSFSLHVLPRSKPCWPKRSLPDAALRTSF